MKWSLFCLVSIFTLSCNNQSAVKLDFSTLSKPAENPIIKADSTYTFVCPIENKIIRWQKADVFNPAAIIKDNKVYLLYRCEDNPAASLSRRTSRIGMAYSSDGIHFTKYPTPVLYPDSSKLMQYDYPGGCEDPRIVETEEGLYVLTYTSWNYKTARLTIAFSNDLIHWEKKALALGKAYNGKFIDRWSKSGSIVTKMKNGKQVVAKINGKYWMYWGEGFIWLASSDNLIDWNPVLDTKGDIKVIVGIRKNKFDSFLSECGPPAIITDEGIVLYYNGKNAEDENADSKLPKGTYSVGKLVFDINKMDSIIYQSDTCILKPTLPHELSGQYASGTTFLEGMVRFQSKWFLYYGTADSYIGVAVIK